MQRILQRRIVPVVVIDMAEDTVPLAEAFLSSGLDVMKNILRTPVTI